MRRVVAGAGASRHAHLRTGAALALVAAVVIALVLVLRPAPLTGDREADAACRALAQATLQDGGMSGAKLALLPDDERREVVREVVQHTERSTIEAIRHAGTAFGAATDGGAGPLLGGDAGFVMAVDQFQDSCARYGWTPQHAGLVGRT